MTRRACLTIVTVCLVSSCASAPTSPVTPAVGVRVDYQLGGSYPPDPGVEVVVRDRTAEPAAGLYNVCYLNAFQAQPGDAANWTINGQDLTLRDHDGHRVVDHDWDEALLDTSTATRRSAIAQVVNDWIDQCGHAGFRAVELDNLDSFTRSQGYLSPEDNLALARTLVSRAHQNGLAVAQKNAAEFAQRARDAGFDFAIAEECQHYDECDLYTNVYGPHVIEIEYGDQPAADFIAACDVNASRISVLRRDRGLAPKGAPGHLAQWCP